MKVSLVAMVMIVVLPFNILAQKKADVALTPPMGWNSWNYFACDVSEALIKEMADAMAANGMAEVGYEYIVIDDCWQVSRDENGKIVEDPVRFPSGIKALADYVHSKGLKFGIYSDAGKRTCQERPGSLGYEEIDAKTYEEWGVDYLKYDWCHNGIFRTSKETYPTMAKALYELDRPILFSMCNWGRQKSWEWAGDYAHIWRTTHDIKPTFSGVSVFFLSVLRILDKQDGLEKHGGVNGWNDPDMLQVGNGDLTMDENQAHFALWSMLAAPLMAGNDLRNMPPDVLSILTNKEAIAINQDALGKQGYRLINGKDFNVYVKELSNDEWAVCLLNRGKAEQTIDFNFRDQLKLEQDFTVHNIWSNEDIGTSDATFKFDMPSHSVVFVRLRR
ncbi:MAG: glycoside hydrolase family 27 protein [Chitinophagales bacterium]